MPQCFELAGRPLGPAMPDALAGPLLQGDDRNGPSGRHGRTEETHKHYNGLTISPMPANSRYAW